MDFRFYSILFIEEPEAHLHPKIQVQLMEIFAELTKVGVKVVMTTHSNYMFNKLSNMLLKKEIEVDKVGSYHLVMTDKGSVVNPDMQATEEGMEDHNFVDTAEELYNERLLAYETLNENAN
jgi:predicted ATPase